MATIIKDTIQKALNNGFSPDGIENVSSFKTTVRDGQAWVRWFNNDGEEVIQDIEHVIYAHSFAKALWDYKGSYKEIGHGRSVTYHAKGGVHAFDAVTYWLPMWQYHLQMLVISDDPIAYLKENA